MATPEHHFCFDKAQWSRGYARDIRQERMLRAPLVWSTHVALHNSISIVPVPDRHTLQRVVSIFEPTDTHIDTIHCLIGAIDLASGNERVHPDDRLLSELTMRALGKQIPFIQQGLMVA